MANKVQTLIIGAGPAGLACALRLKTLSPSHDVVVLDKAEAPGNHNLSGAVLETASLEALLDSCVPAWRDDPQGKELLARRVARDNILFLPGKTGAVELAPLLRLARALKLNVGQMLHQGNAIISLSRLCAWLTRLARDKGVEILSGLAAKDILWDERLGAATGVTLVDQGLEADGSRLPSYVQGETILAESLVLAEGCDGLVTEQLVKKAGLTRRHVQMFSIGLKEIIQVSPEQYKSFGADRVVHAVGYPLWAPLRGPSMFGGGTVYAMDENRLAVGLIVGLDWTCHDFNPQDALQAFKEHAFVHPFIHDGKVVEAGAKMIPEGGWRAIPRDSCGCLGRANVLILGDSAGLVNMVKIKGIHNAIQSGQLAGEALAETHEQPQATAGAYTAKLSRSTVETEMHAASKWRQLVAKLGPTLAFPLAAVTRLMPAFSVEPDFRATTTASYPFKRAVKFDKMTFAALAKTLHREGQPSHLTILNREVCDRQCKPRFGAPCITFCPDGVYEEIHGEVKPANPSNCLHCKTCQRKCPFDNIRWTVPEGGGGPRYTDM